MRALNAVGINKDHFGALLIPIVEEKLPSVVRLQISRKLGKENWDVQNFIDCINQEISAREHFEYLKKPEDNTELEYTTSTLMAGIESSR